MTTYTYHLHSLGGVARDTHCTRTGCLRSIPVAVIPYKDDAALIRLLDALERVGWEVSDASSIADLRAALKKFSDPTPPVVKPDEPDFWLAVVKDEEGKWYREDDRAKHPWKLRDSTWRRNWDDFSDTVQVLDGGTR